MGNVARGKKVLAIAVLGCICAALIAVPVAQAFYYVKADSNVAASGKGAMEISCTVDATAIGEGTRTDLIFVPEGSNASAVLDEMVWSSESQNGLKAIHNYKVKSVRDEFSGKKLECTTYEAASQKPGTHTKFDGKGTKGESTQLNRFDAVVVTVK